MASCSSSDPNKLPPPTFAWGVKTADNRFLMDAVSGGPWLADRGGGSSADVEVVVVPKVVWDSLNLSNHVRNKDR